MNYLIDGNPDYLIGFKDHVLVDDPSCYELHQFSPWSAAVLTLEVEEARRESLRLSWQNDPARRVTTSLWLSERRKSGAFKPNYTPERNAKIAAYHARKRLARAAL